MKIKTNVRAGLISTGKKPITCTTRHTVLF
jgi:hypothetical protein